MALCAGGGGLELGVGIAEPGLVVVCHVEREAFAAATLVCAMEEGFLAPAPVWDDLKTFDGRPWRGAVDLVLAGYPCQPFSLAGKRRGDADPRHLWPHVARVIRECEPRRVFLENVPGHLRLGGAAVAGELRAMGYRVAGCLVSAEEVGATHLRERLFLMADAPGARFGGGGPGAGGAVRDAARGAKPDGRRGALDDAADSDGRAFRERGDGRGQGPDAGRQADRRPGEPGAAVEHAPRLRGQGRASEGTGPRRAPGAGVALADAANLRGTALLGDESNGDHDGGLPLFPPAPGDRDAWDAVLARRAELAPSLPQSELRGVADGMASRVDRLRLLGNGVVPLAAAYAWRTLHAALRPGRLSGPV